MAFNVGIYGAAGFTGQELIKLLNHCPEYTLSFISSDQYAGQSLAEVTPEAKAPGFRFGQVKFSPNADIFDGADVLFLATPNNVAADIAARFRKDYPAVKIVDVSGAHRLQDRAEFDRVYGFAHPAWENVTQSAFGIPELNRSQIKDAHLVANPGCYPTGSIGPLTLLLEGLKAMGCAPDWSQPVIIDAKSGVSGAGGRVEGPGFAFNGVYENFRAYKVLGHQHEPEIAQAVNQEAHRLFDQKLDFVFTPHLLPLFRGILSTIYIATDRLWTDDALAQLNQALDQAISAGGWEFFGRLDDTGAVDLKTVQHTNRVHFSVAGRGRHLVAVSAVDNLIKGAAGQALQNANLMLGLPEGSGLP